MFAISLPVLFLALAIHPSVSSEGVAPSAARALPRTTEIDGRLFYRHSLLPVDVGLYDEDKRGWSKRVMLEAALGPLLIKPLISIVVEYNNSYGSRSRQFAEEMYHELWDGKTDLLKELYDLKRGTLKEPHHFWDYLSRRAQATTAFACMLWQTWKKHRRLKKTLKRFAKLVFVRVPQTVHFTADYFGGDLFSPLKNICVDEWPQALLNDRAWIKSIRFGIYGEMGELHYMLMQGDLTWLKRHVEQITWNSEDWITVFRFLHAVEPAFLHRFLEIPFAKGSSGDRRLFNETAPIAMGVDPALSSALIAIANDNDWAEPVAEKMEMQVDLADHKEAGGDVHMQPLLPVAQSLDAICCGAWFAASSTLKTVADEDGVQLHIAAGNVLCALSTWDRCYLHIRTFENDKVSTHQLGSGHPVQVQVQHEDVIFMDWGNECPSFLKAIVADRGLTRRDCLEYLKAFCYSARDRTVYFVAIVQADKLVGVEEEERLVDALTASAVKVEKMDKREDGRKRKERGGGEEHMSKKSHKEKRKKKSEKGEERGGKRPKKEHGNRQRCRQKSNARRDQDELQPS